MKDASSWVVIQSRVMKDYCFFTLRLQTKQKDSTVVLPTHQQKTHRTTLRFLSMG